MPLSPEQEQRLRTEAAKAGYDPDAAVAIANGRQAGAADKGAAASEAEPVKIFQYHLPFMRVRELRTYLGLAERIPDDDLLCGEFLADHGGALAAPAPKSETPTE
jgi:hypothetical protein